MKKKIILFAILLMIISIPIIIKVTHKSETPKTKTEEKINTKEETKTDESDEEQKIEITKEERKDDNTSESSKESNTNKKNSSTKDSSTNNKNTSTPSNSNNETKEVEVKVEEPKKQTDDKKHYIDVPDPNSYYYSFHHGHIDFSSLDECQKNSEKYLMMDVNDIYGSWCMEVQDENGKVLVAYLYLKCTSGNCDRYKGY